MDTNLKNKFLKINEHIKFQVIKNNKRKINLGNLNYSNNKTEIFLNSNKEDEFKIIDYGQEKWNLNPPFTTTLLHKGVFRFFYNKNWSKFPSYSGLMTHKNGSASMKIIEDIFVDRNHKEYGKMFAGLERNGPTPEMTDIFLQTFEGEFEDFLKRNEENKLKKISQAEKLWKKYVSGEKFSDIISAASESQKNIVFNRRYLRENLTINGYAGSGKTYVLNELSQKIEGSINLYPNDDVKSKSISFFKELNSNSVSCFTFVDFNIKLKEEIDKALNKINKYHSKDWFSLFTNDSTIQIEILKGVFVDVKPLVMEKSKIKIKLEFKRIFNIKIKEEKVSSILRELYEYENDIYQLKKFSKQFIEKENIKSISIDEAPLIAKYEYLDAFVKSSINNIHYIVSYDKYQHSKSEIFESIENVEKLNEVYRTTKEIFSLSTRNMEIDNAIVPVSIKGSVTFTREPMFKKIIKFSDFLANYQEYIGNEYLELSIDFDVNPEWVSSRYTYILITRAIAKVNIFGAYQNEVKNGIRF